MRPLDYEPRERTPPRATRLGYWSAFAAAALVGLVCTAILDDLLTMMLRGHHTDSGATCLSIGGIILAVPLAGILRSLRPQTRSWVAALVGLLSPLLAFAAVIVIL